MIASHLSTLFRGLTSPVYGRLHGGGTEGLLFPRLCCLALGVVAIAAVRTIEKRFWTFVAVIFSIAALGEKLHIHRYDGMMLSGRWVFVPLPMDFARFIPILNLVRVSSRFPILFQLALVCLAAQGTRFVLEKFTGHRRRRLAVALSACLLLDLACAPYPSSPMRDGRIYRIISEIPCDFAILDIPFWVGDGVRSHGEHTNDTISWAATQATHNKPILGTLVSRVDPDVVDRFRHSPLISAIEKAQGGKMTEGTLASLPPDVARQ